MAARKPQRALVSFADVDEPRLGRGLLLHPIVSLWMPYQAMKEIWQGSDPDPTVEAFTVRVPALLPLVVGPVHRLRRRVAGGPAAQQHLGVSTETLMTRACVELGRSLVTIVAALLAIAVVRAVARRQDERAVARACSLTHQQRAAVFTAIPTRPCAKVAKNFLDDKQPRVQGDFIMLIVRQPSRLAIKAAFAACRGRLFGGWVIAIDRSQESSKKMTETANPHVWRAARQEHRQGFLPSRPGKPRRLFSFLGVFTHGNGDHAPLPEQGACVLGVTSFEGEALGSYPSDGGSIPP